jgi:hypothetical protein
MVRPLRIEIVGGVHHVTTPGGERRDVVRDDQDRAAWVRLLDRVAERFGWRLYAWALREKCKVNTWPQGCTSASSALKQTPTLATHDRSDVSNGKGFSAKGVFANDTACLARSKTPSSSACSGARGRAGASRSDSVV